METVLASATKTAAGAETGVLVSGLAAAAAVLWVDFTLLSSATGVPSARVVIEQSAIGDFTDPVPVCEFACSGPVVSGAPVRMSQRLAAEPATLIGVASAKMRANLVQLLGGTPSLTYQAGIKS